MFGFAKKIGMTRLFVEGKAVPVTVLEVDDNFVVQLKTEEKDGYNAVQVGAFKKNDKKTPKAKKGHLKKQADLDGDFHCLGEFRGVEVPEDQKVINIENILENEFLKITGKSIGRGFTGAVKRWGFAGQPKSHGHDHLKAVGSIGSRWPQRVSKGKKMAGQYGNETSTVRSLKVVGVDKENNLFFVAGSVPGANNGYVKFQQVKKK